MSAWPGYPTNFTWGTDCVNHEWCDADGAHEHGETCASTCQCRVSRVLWDVHATTKETR